MADKLIPGQRPPGWTPPDGSAKSSGGCMKIAGIAAAVIVGLALLASILPDPDKHGAKEVASIDAPAPARKVTPEDLRSAYAENEVAAQRAFGVSPIEMSGKIHDITLDITNDPVLSFETSDRFSHVQAGFDDDAADAVAQLRKGQTVTVRCAKVGEVIGTPVLRDCVLLP